jgi:hypothetical protein
MSVNHSWLGRLATNSEGQNRQERQDGSSGRIGIVVVVVVSGGDVVVVVVVVVGLSNNWSGGGLVVVVVVAETAGFVDSTLNPGAGRIDFVVEEVADELVDASLVDELPEVVVTLLVVVVVVGLELGAVVVVGTAGSGTVVSGNETWGVGAAARMGRPVGLDAPLP